ncbi:hypothetical protein F4556_005563 [Kitasatospora gansuensis]|uniref:Uncharacterized protein n=1 Tax=Kitasatospora gansuensis TaxID=258050 RepID=A0A7W7SGG3_9ACTN|nr:hypothetical protein [Kitasatospora gansuensis]MBB4950028.1 hypothetical protein [Kitasatospora gansuensis]
MTRRVRATQRGSWLPLLLLGVLTLGGILVSRLTFSVRTVTCPPIHSSSDTIASCVITKQGSPLYWTLGLLLAYAATAFFYIRSSRNRGVGTPVRPYVLAGIVLVALAAATEFWTLRHLTPGLPVDFWGLHLDPGSGAATFLGRFTGAAASVGLPLLVLAWVERSRALLLFALAYLALQLVPVTASWAGLGPLSPWSALPRLLVSGVFLLLGALGFALAQLPRRRGES